MKRITFRSLLTIVAFIILGIIAPEFFSDFVKYGRENRSDVSETVGLVRVVDGDTLVVYVDGKKETVRLIGVNTPETVDPRKKVECFGKEASEFVKKFVSGKEMSVRIEKDASQGERDYYDRLLGYAYVGDVLLNKEIIRQGYGHEYTYSKPYQFQTDFKAAQQEAREAKVGLWADDACEDVAGGEDGKVKIIQ